MTTGHTKQLADSGDRLSTRAAVFALLLARTLDALDQLPSCPFCETENKYLHAPNCLNRLFERALDADAADLDAIRAGLMGGD